MFVKSVPGPEPESQSRRLAGAVSTTPACVQLASAWRGQLTAVRRSPGAAAPFRHETQKKARSQATRRRLALAPDALPRRHSSAGRDGQHEGSEGERVSASPQNRLKKG